MRNTIEYRNVLFNCESKDDKLETVMAIDSNVNLIWMLTDKQIDEIKKLVHDEKTN